MKKGILTLLFSITLFFILTSHLNVFCIESHTAMAYFDSDGSLRFDTTDKKATTDIRYRTIGWNICKDKDLGVQGVCATIPMLSQVSDPVKNGYVTTHFSTDYDTVVYLGQRACSHTPPYYPAPAWMYELTHNGGTVWLNACMVVLDNRWVSGQIDPVYDKGMVIGVTQLGNVYTSLNGIRHNAQDQKGKFITWSSPDGLESHFDVEAYFPPQAPTTGSKVVVRNYLDVNGKLVPLTQWNHTDKIELNQTITEKHKTTAGVTFVGNRHNANSDIQTGNINAGDVTVTNDGTFSTYYINYYYTQAAAANWHETNIDSVRANKFGIIAADNRHNEKFNVALGIPTSENLYTNVFCYNYIYDTVLKNITGVQTYDIAVKRTYIMRTYGYDSYTDKETDVVKVYTVSRVYSYWQIQNFDAFDLHGAVINNTPLPGGKQTLAPQGYTSPDIDVWHSASVSDHVLQPVIFPEDGTVDAGSKLVLDTIPDEDLSGYAEGAVGQVQVKNDRLFFDGAKIISDDEVTSSTEYPHDMPEGSIIGENVLYKNNLLIDKHILNGLHQSTGDIYYNRLGSSIVDGSDGLNNQVDLHLSSTDSVPTLNSVEVHTPVVCDAGIYTDLRYNQRYNPDTSKASLVLDRPFKIHLPTTGKHLSIPGYGERDYIKYTEKKQVQFPFDVFYGNNNSGTFIPKNTWFSVNLSEDDSTFYLPIWVDEGDYDVDFREVAENAPSMGASQNLANLDDTKYVATKSIPVQVSGQIFNFRVSDVKDYPSWQTTFRTGKNTTKHTSNYYYVGQKDKNEKNRGNSSKYTLPLIDGSNGKYKNLGSLKLGTKFTFDLETIGNYYAKNAYLSIKPTFYWVDKNGNNRQQVDLYYNEKIKGKQQNLVGIGSSLDKTNVHYIRLCDPYRNVPTTDITTTTSILNSTHQSNITKSKFMKQNTKIGSFSNLSLTSMLRTFIGDTSYITSSMRSAGVDLTKVKESQQKWYGEYYLPSNTYVVKKGFNIIDYAKTHHGVNGRENVFLKNGYIIVNFNISAVKNTTPFLNYYTNSCNMWNIEGFDYTKKDWKNTTYTLFNGDVVFYNQTKLSNSYTSGGTH